MAEAIQALPPKEALTYFRKKGYKIGFSWQDVWKEEHARAFTVAKAMRLDLLEDIRGAVDRALADGLTFEQFKKDLAPTLQQKGWWGKGMVFDPATGNLQLAQLGSSRRLRIIYDTNLRMARAAGQWQRIERIKHRRPYLWYRPVQDGRTRPHHLDKRTVILPVDHPFWNEWYPPNGWRCRCSVVQLSDRDLRRRDLKVSDPGDLPPLPRKNVVNGRTGELENIPVGIDKGFNYNVGREHMRGIVPPPLSGPIRTPAYMKQTIRANNEIHTHPMPIPRPVSKTRLIDGDATSEEQAVQKFIGEFGTAKHNLFIDKTGESLIIGRDFFTDAITGELKISKKVRKDHVLLLADALKEPDEIWHIWAHHGQRDKWILRRRYFTRFDIEGIVAPMVVVVEVGQDGWRGVTAFRQGKAELIDNNRHGTIVYRRDEGEN
tara:strand:+ start:3088 stop:4386 length:1299 start_codon:yes stop_codon:yes gene_type:complete